MGKPRKLSWYDLNYMERVEAASQVHAVVFAQLGALAHAMIELGCGLQRSCAFVRRMAVRKQLPTVHRIMLLQHLLNRSDTGQQPLLESQQQQDGATKGSLESGPAAHLVNRQSDSENETINTNFDLETNAPPSSSQSIPAQGAVLDDSSKVEMQDPIEVKSEKDDEVGDKVASIDAPDEQLQT